MRRIAHFIHSLDPGGAESMVLELCSRLASYDYEPEVLHFGNPWIEEDCRRRGVPEAVVPAHRDFKSGRRLLRFALRFRRFLRARGVDLLHAHLYGAVVAGSLAGRLGRIPCVGTLHDHYTFVERPSRVTWLRVASSLGLRLVTVSRHLEGELRSAGRFRSGRLRTIMNGVDVERFAAARGAHRPAPGLDAPAVAVVSVGRLVAVKGHDLLLRAVARLSPAPPTRLLLVGEGPERPVLEALCKELRIEDRVCFLGPSDDVPAILAASDCFALASRSEGLSCSIAEALAAGLPCVVTDVGGNPELVDDGQDGFVVPAGDVARFAAQLQRVVNDPGLRARFGERAREAARARLSASRMVEEYVGLYRELGGR
jgi:glycosyltransferase involved in cell wall biosynthesis